jgi:hypothetical protein
LVEITKLLKQDVMAEFEPAFRLLIIQVDAAYSTKSRRYAASIISHIMSPEARSATI